MARRPVLISALLSRARDAAIAAQAASSRRRNAVLDVPMDRVAWMPLLAELSLAFEGTLGGAGKMLQVTPGRPLFARLAPSRVHRFDIFCNASDGWSPRLYIDGVPVDTTG